MNSLNIPEYDKSINSQIFIDILIKKHAPFSTIHIPFTIQFNSYQDMTSKNYLVPNSLNLRTLRNPSGRTLVSTSQIMHINGIYY